MTDQTETRRKPVRRSATAPVVIDPVVVALPETALIAPAIAADMPATAPVEAASDAQDHAMTDTMNTAAEQTKATMTEMQAKFQDGAKGAMEKGARAAADMGDMAKGNLEAMVESSKIAAEGAQKLAQDAAAFAKSQFEATTHAMKTLAAAKSPTEFMQLQADFTRTAFDRYMAEASRSTEAMLKLAGDVTQPLSNRFALAAQKMKVAA